MAILLSSFLLATFWGSVGNLGEPQNPPTLPPFEKVTAAITEQIGGKRDFKKDDLIVRSEVTAALDRLQTLGWIPSDRKEIEKRVPADSDHVVKQLRTPKGIEAMRKIAEMPLGYDRLFRLGSLENGHRLVRDVCQGADGYKLISYMTESPGGKHMGEMVSKAPHGADFNAPTGQIYTLSALLKQLRASYDRDAAAAAKSSRR